MRKLLVPLVRDGLMSSFLGKRGGVRLGRPAERITLRDIYASALGEKKLLTARGDVPHRCLVSSNIDRVVGELSSDMEAAVLGLLAGRTLAQALLDLEAAEQRARPYPSSGSSRAVRKRT